MDVEVIKSKKQYAKALETLSELMDRNPSPESKEGKTLELLLVVVRDYEQNLKQPLQHTAVDAIKFRMEQMQLSKQDLIPYLGSSSRISEVLSGKRNLSIEMIRKLHEGLDIPLESLMRRKQGIARRRARKSNRNLQKKGAVYRSKRIAHSSITHR